MRCMGVAYANPHVGVPERMDIDITSFSYIYGMEQRFTFLLYAHVRVLLYLKVRY